MIAQHQVPIYSLGATLVAIGHLPHPFNLAETVHLMSLMGTCCERLNTDEARWLIDGCSQLEVSSFVISCMLLHTKDGPNEITMRAVLMPWLQFALKRQGTFTFSFWYPAFTLCLMLWTFIVWECRF